MDKKTIDTYNELAKEYDEETIDFWERFPRTFLDKFIASVKKGGKVLDVGSGPGRDGLLLKEAGFDVTCLDASAAMIELSKQKGLESVLGDFNELPFEDGTFDGVWAYTSLLHVPKSEVEKPLREIRRVLKFSGIFSLGLMEGDKELYRESSGVKKERWFSFYTKEEIEQLLDRNGFEVIYFEKFNTGKDYLNYVSRKK